MAIISDSSSVPSPALYFLQNISTWEKAPPLHSQWTVSIYPINRSYLFSQIEHALLLDQSDFTVVKSGGNNLPTVQNGLLGNSSQPNVEGLGLFYAQSVTIPKEGFAVGAEGSNGMSGYLKGTVGEERLSHDGKTLKIGFLETNLDFVSCLIRPWIIACSYNGLLERLDKSIKADIIVREHTNGNANNIKPERRVHRFSGCAPMDVSEIELKQYGEEINITPVNWTFIRHTYEVNSTGD